MNRKEALNYIGKKIRVVEPLHGNYIGILEEVIAESKKPWRGKVKIEGIEQLKLVENSLKVGSSYEINGSKITPLLELKKEELSESTYQVFIAELEKAALDSLTRGLQHFHMKHEHCVACHYTLIKNGKAGFSNESVSNGVNFITYMKNNEMLLVQHHYERNLTTHSVFDRFEFTNDKGKRMIYTYTTQLT